MGVDIPSQVAYRVGKGKPVYALEGASRSYVLAVMRVVLTLPSQLRSQAVLSNGYATP
jgi:hypothetical protein